MADPIDIFVDLDALQNLANGLSRIEDSLKNYKDDVQNYGDALGSNKVKGQLDSFMSGWKDGRGKIEDNVNKLLGKVKGVAQTYQEQEAALIKQSKPGHK